MRITFTPEPETANRLIEIARTSKRSLSAVVNEMVRVALNSKLQQNLARRPYRVQTFKSKLRPGLDPTKMSEILADIETEEFLEKDSRARAAEQP